MKPSRASRLVGGGDFTNGDHDMVPWEFGNISELLIELSAGDTWQPSNHSVSECFPSGFGLGFAVDQGVKENVKQVAKEGSGETQTSS